MATIYEEFKDYFGDAESECRMIIKGGVYDLQFVIVDESGERWSFCLDPKDIDRLETAVFKGAEVLRSMQ
jgi:hypothetical protein